MDPCLHSLPAAVHRGAGVCALLCVAINSWWLSVFQVEDEYNTAKNILFAPAWDPSPFSGRVESLSLGPIEGPGERWPICTHTVASQYALAC